jgi:propanol-preferring alcohol dehydrogenase
MHTMRALQITRPDGPYELRELPVPEPRRGELRVRVEACGMCHSDVFAKSGQYPGLVLPRVLGHEVAGRVDALGEEVRGFRIGDRVGVGWNGGHCGACLACRAGDFPNCAHGQICGLSYDGGYAEYLVCPANGVARIPDELDAAHAAPLLCAGITTFNALRNSGARPGDTVAVQGIGGLGHLALQYAAQLGFRVVALSHGASKEALARELGAHEYIDTQRSSAAEGLQRLGGAALVLATAPHAAAIASTVEGLTPRGKLLIVAVPDEPLTISAMALISGRSVAGWPSGSAIDSEETMRFSARTGVLPRIERFPLEAANEAYAQMMENRVRFRAVLVP